MLDRHFVFSRGVDEPSGPGPEVTPDDFLPYFTDPDPEPEDQEEEGELELSSLTNGVILSKTPAKKPKPRPQDPHAGKKGKVLIRDVGGKIQEEGEAKHGPNPDILSRDSYNRIVTGIVEDVGSVLGDENMHGAIGWYTAHWNDALDEISLKFPELESDEARRVLFTALVGVTSQGNNVYANLYMALKVYARYRDTGVISPEGIWGTKMPYIEENIRRIGQVVKKFGLEDGMKYLYQEGDAKELASQAISDGLLVRDPQNFPHSGSKADKQQLEEYLRTIKVPMSGVLFGPKVGLFFANLLGMTDYVTIDLWMSRSVGRYRQSILPRIQGEGMSRKEIEAFKAEEERKRVAREEQIAKGKASKAYKPRSLKGLAAYKDMKGHPEWNDNTAWLHVFDDARIQRLHYAKHRSNDGLPEYVMRARRLRTVFMSLQETPWSSQDRVLQMNAVQEATRNLNAKFGTNLTPSDVQALLWYFEKDYYAHRMGIPTPHRINFRDVSKDVLADFETGNEESAKTWKDPSELPGDEDGEDEEGEDEEESVSNESIGVGGF